MEAIKALVVGLSVGGCVAGSVGRQEAAQDGRGDIEITIDERSQAQKAASEPRAEDPLGCATMHCMGPVTLFYCDSSKAGWCDELLPACARLSECPQKPSAREDSAYYCCW